jgi:hypothetical protein
VVAMLASSPMRPQPTRRLPLVPVALAAILAAAPGAPAVAEAQGPASPDPAPWPAERRREVLDKTLELRLAPDLAHLTAGERRAVEELLAVGEIMQRLYEEGRHHQAAEARATLAAMPLQEEVAELRTLYRLFQGPVATTLDNRRQPFLAVDPEVPGKNVYPWGIEKAEVEAFLAAHPERRAEILDERTVVRRATAESLGRDRAALARHPALAVLHPGLDERLAALAASLEAYGADDGARDATAPAGTAADDTAPGGTSFRDEAAPQAAAALPPALLYAVPYAVAWADELGEAQRRLFTAAAAVEGDDAELARYLRNRGRDLLSNDYESGDASWITGRFENLNAQIGAYETYDDALFGVKAFHSLSLLATDREATAELRRALADIQQIEDLLPYEPRKRVRSDVPVGVYHVVADFGQARGTNTATILPNDALFSRRYGRTILLRENVMTHPELFAQVERAWRAAAAPAFADHLAPEGGFHRTLWHEIGHYLGPDATRGGEPLDRALQGWADALEEMKADLVSLFALHHLHGEGEVPDERLRAVQASGILRTLVNNRPRIDQPYQTMQLAQLNFFLDRGLVTVDDDGRLEIHRERYPPVVRELLAEVMELQLAGDPAAAEAFFTRWTEWRDDLHEPLAERLREAQGTRYRLVRYGALGE